MHRRYRRGRGVDPIGTTAERRRRHDVAAASCGWSRRDDDGRHRRLHEQDHAASAGTSSDERRKHIFVVCHPQMDEPLRVRVDLHIEGEVLGSVQRLMVIAREQRERNRRERTGVGPVPTSMGFPENEINIR